MDMYKVNDHALLTVLLDYAPSGREQSIVATRYRALVHDCQIEEDPDRAVLGALAGWLADGLRHGNWPWVTAAR